MGCCGISLPSLSDVGDSLSGAVDTVGGMLGLGGDSNSASANATAEANNEVTIDNQVDVNINLDSVAEATADVANAITDGNEWHRMSAEEDKKQTQIAKANLAIEMQAKNKELQIAEETLKENKKNNKVMIALSATGIVLMLLSQGGQKK